MIRLDRAFLMEGNHRFRHLQLVKEHPMRLHRSVRMSLAGLALVFMVGTLGCGKEAKAPPTSANSTASGPSTGPAPSTTGKPVATAKPDFTLTAESFAKEYLVDAKAAEGKYMGKAVELEGQVESANPVINTGLEFFLEGAKKSPDDLGVKVRCLPAPAVSSRMPWLGKGQKVKVIGTVGPLQGGLFVFVGDCQVTELEPSKTPQVTAEQVTADFAKDPEAAKDKYVGKQAYEKEILVEGTIADLVKKGDFYLVKLGGANPDLRVSCMIGKLEFDDLKKGQKVRVKGNVAGFGQEDKFKELKIDSAFLLKDK